MLIVRFIHFLGGALWIGGAIAAMIMAISSRGESPDVRAGTFRLLQQVQTLVIGLGALLTVGSGLVMTMSIVQSGGAAAMAAPRIWVMQTAGFIAGVLVLFGSVPLAVKLGRLAIPTEDGQLLPAFERYRKRQAVISSVAGVLALVALFAGVVLR